MGKKIVFFDVDGTLIDYGAGMKDVLESTKDAINQIKENGHMAVLATGRPKSFLKEELVNLDFDAYITSNGAYIEIGDNIIYNKEIDKNTLKEAIELFKKEGMEFVLEGQRCSYFTDLNTENMKRLLDGFFLPVSNITDSWNIDYVSSNKMVIFVNGQEQLNTCIKHLGNKFRFMNHPGMMSYDVYFNDCTKADGIKRLIEYLQLDINDTYAFGDGINDIEMLQAVKYGIAMGNANEKLKQVAFCITNDVFSHGIYNSLKELQVI